MSINLARMDDAYRAAGVRYNGLCSGAAAGHFTVMSADGQEIGVFDVNPLDQALATSTAAGVDVRVHQARALYQIYTDLQALTLTQKTNVWADMSAPSGGAPRKYLLDTGPNAGSIGVMDWAIMESGASGNSLMAARMRLAAMYVQDNPLYLVKPPFDNSINVPGEEP